MLKKTITFEDYNGTEITEDFYFNLTKAELVELQLSSKEGFTETLQAIIKSGDGQQILDHFKKIILMAVGRKSDDGRRFIKTQEIRDDFSQTEAYSELFVESATNAEAAAVFVNSIVPAGLVQEIQTEVSKVPTVGTHDQADVLDVIGAPAESNMEASETEIPVTTDEELLKMNPQEMTQAQLKRVFYLKTRSAR